jgi:hypothetical protein
LENRISTWVAIGTSLLTLSIGGGWYQEYQKNQRARQEANERLMAEDLRPIATHLGVNEKIFSELRSEPYSQPGWGILESYLIKIQRDGVPLHALMKKRIDTLVDNNTRIITLLTKYSGYVKTPEFKEEADKFLDHAVRYNDRWKTLLEVFAAQAAFPADAPVFPAGFPAAVETEIKARGGGT